MAPTPPGADWANTEQTIPRQPWSLVGWAARILRRSPSQAPRPWCLLNERQQVDGYYKAREEETAILQDAHASVHRLTVLCDDEETVMLARFCHAETAELQAAAGHYGPQGKPTGTLPARPAALTVLIEAAHNSSETKHAALVLDAAAFLARAGSDTDRLVSRVRMGVLFRGHARKYAHERLGRARNPRAKVSVCLTWVEEGTCAEEGGPVLRSNHTELLQCKTAQQYVERIRDASASLVPESTPSTALARRALSALSRSLDLERSPIANAHDESVVECDREFWGLLRRSMPALANLAVGKTNEAHHPLDWFQAGGLPCRERVFLKLVPRPPQGVPLPPLASEHLYHGLLLHKHGEHDEAMHFCKKETAKEKESRQNPNDPWGLPIPTTTPDALLGLHVLCVRSEWACIAAHIGAYGVGTCVPGICPTSRSSEGHVPRLVFSLVPFDAKFIESAFALPCTIDLATPIQDGNHLIDATEAALDCYKSIFDDGTQDAEDAEGAPVPSRFGLAKHVSDAPPEDLALASAIGVPFGGGAFRIGDVHERVTQSDFQAPHLDGFLRTAIEQLGRDEPLSAAFALLAEKCKDNERLLGEKRGLQSRVSELESQLAAAEAPDSPKRVKREPIDKGPETCMPRDHLWPLLERLGCIQKAAVTLEAPIERGKVLALLLAMQRARGLEECMEAAKAKSKQIRKSGMLDAEPDCNKRFKLVIASEVCIPDACPLFLVWQDGDAPVKFEMVPNLNEEEGALWDTLPLESTEEIFGPGLDAGVLVFDAQTRELVPFSFSGP
jgi:hypothetical protein